VTAELYLAFVAASALLILTPGPMVAYLIATALSRGPAHALAAVAGSLIAAAAHLAVAGFGLAIILSAASAAFFWLKWIGVFYLVYLAVKALRAPADDLAPGKAAQGSIRRSFAEGLLVNLTNPKTMLFHGAFLPLFMSPSAPAGPQLFLLAVTFLVISGSLDSLWVLTASRSRPLLAKIGRWRHRLTGGVLLTAAASLALMRK
jgi:threonine/homoserine/homoserine lactone efflux protein